MSKQRPLSPHLTIYKLQISSALSILHRITGFVLFFGVLALTWVLIILTMQNSGVAFVECDLTPVIESVLFKITLIAIAFCLYYHLFNGIRHLFWDIGFGFELKSMHLSGVFVVVLSVLFTLLTLYFAIWK